MKKVSILIVLVLGCFIESKAQKVALKSNLLYDATTTMNLGLEFGLARKWTLDVPVNYNPWKPDNGRRLRHWGIQPEVRYWTCRSFSGHFFGAHLLGGEYNFGGMLPLGIKPSQSGLGSKRYEGWAAGAGLSYGYSWILGRRWNLEATLGLGYLRLDYDRFECKTCGDRLGEGKKNYFGPTKAGVSLIYIIK